MTSSQFNVLLSELGDLRKHMNARFDKVEDRFCPLEADLQQRIGADKKVQQFAGVGRSTLALVISLGTAIVAVAKLLST